MRGYVIIFWKSSLKHQQLIDIACLSLIFLVYVSSKDSIEINLTKELQFILTQKIESIEKYRFVSYIYLFIHSFIHSVMSRRDEYFDDISIFIFKSVKWTLLIFFNYIYNSRTVFRLWKYIQEIIIVLIFVNNFKFIFFWNNVLVDI